jgi:hypothetical protein
LERASGNTIRFLVNNYQVLFYHLQNASIFTNPLTVVCTVAYFLMPHGANVNFSKTSWKSVCTLKEKMN